MSSTTHKTEPHFELLPGMIDSHFHSAMMEKKGMNVRPLISQALQTGLAGGIDIGIEAGDTARRHWIRQEFPQIKLATGLYPAEAEYEEIADRIALLCEDIERFSPAAVGEMGVDRYWNYATVERQQELMRQQIEVANRYRLPIIIHNRDADAEVLEVLKDTPPRAGGVLHCFSSNAEGARSFVDAGLYISFAGNLTYKKSEALREAAAAVPLDRLLAETDSPFLSPQKLRGKLNHPGQVGFVYRSLAELHGQELTRLIQLISENFRRLFGG